MLKSARGARVSTVMQEQSQDTVSTSLAKTSNRTGTIIASIIDYRSETSDMAKLRLVSHVIYKEVTTIELYM
jgi:hypothetical protein